MNDKSSSVSPHWVLNASSESEVQLRRNRGFTGAILDQISNFQPDPLFVPHGTKVEAVCLKALMYTSVINSQDQALCHLFFHCILKDGEMADRELDSVSEKLVAAGLNKALNFKEEIISYREYKESIADEQEYLRYLVEQINPVNELALYTYCAELLLSDNILTEEEESLLKNLGDALGIDDTEQEIAKKIMVQRKVVETEKIF